MIKIYFVFALLFFSLAFSQQKYEFDFVLKYSVNNISDGKKSESVVYFNTENHNYFLRLYKFDDNLMKTDLFDRTTNKVHRFKVIETKKDGEIYFGFEYLFTMTNFHLGKNSKNARFEFSELNSNKTDLSIFSRKNQKKPEQTYELTLQPANINLFPLSRMVIMHPYHFNDNLNFPGNVIVKKAVSTIGKIVCEYRLEEYKNVYMELTLPKTLKSPF